MKLLPSLAIGLGLVGAGLTAPVPTPHLVPLDDGLLVAVDAVLEPSWPDSYAERLSRYASAAVQRLRVFQVTPVFAVDPDDAPVITEDDGEVVLVGDNQWLGAVVWDPSTRILSLDPMSCLVVSVAATHLPVPAQVRRKQPSRRRGATSSSLCPSLGREATAVYRELSGLSPMSACCLWLFVFLKHGVGGSHRTYNALYK